MWAGAGVDRIQGGFAEKLDRQGRAVEEPRRTRVVARQIYVFATASRRGWMALDEGETLVEHGLRCLLGPMRRDDGLFASAVHPDGTLVQPNVDLYEQAFALFALAEAARERPGRLALMEAVALQTLNELRERYRHPVIGFEESQPPSVPLKANPHMHLLEAALVWLQVGDMASVWAELVDELTELALSRLIDPVSGALSEYFDAQWQPESDAARRVIEPGHQFEWSWLLHRVAIERGIEAAAEAARRLDRVGESKGVDVSRNIAIDGLDGHLLAVDRSGRLWPQTERLKSACAAYTDATDAAGADRVVRCMEGLMQYVLDVPAGLWNERMREDGRFENSHCRASSLYHIVCAIDTLPGARLVSSGL